MFRCFKTVVKPKESDLMWKVCDSQATKFYNETRAFLKLKIKITTNKSLNSLDKQKYLHLNAKLIVGYIVCVDYQVVFR